MIQGGGPLRVLRSDLCLLTRKCHYADYYLLYYCFGQLHRWFSLLFRAMKVRRGVIFIISGGRL